MCFLCLNRNLHDSPWPNVLTSISTELINQMLSNVNLLRLVVINRYQSEFYHSDPSNFHLPPYISDLMGKE